MRLGLRLGGVKSHPGSLYMFTRVFFNSNNFAGLWLHDHEVNFGSGLTELKGTVSVGKVR